jgi:hypothetical protein
MDDPHASYKQFISRVIREYESLAVIFRFITIDAERSINEQHREIREHYQRLQRLSWPEWNIEPVADWLAQHPEAARARPEDTRRGKRALRAVAV